MRGAERGKADLAAEALERHGRSFRTASPREEYFGRPPRQDDGDPVFDIIVERVGDFGLRSLPGDEGTPEGAAIADQEPERRVPAEARKGEKPVEAAVDPKRKDDVETGRTERRPNFGHDVILQGANESFHDRDDITYKSRVTPWREGADMAKIVRTDRELAVPTVDAALRAAGHDLVLLPDGATEDVLIAECRDADLILMCYAPIGRRVIESATKLKGIVKYGVGIDAIDIEAAKARAIPVVKVPDYAEETVAEGAMALMLALAKRLKPIDRAMDRDGWVWPELRWHGLDLAGKTLGLIGLGRIGRSVARMAGAGFRMRVLAYDPHADAARFAAAGVERRSDLCAMLADCDFVSIHAVLNAETKGMIGAREFAAMKSNSLFVNVSRGALVDEAALLAALKSGGIAGAAFDVYSREPLNRTDHPLRECYDMDNVILFPHLTFFTKEASDRLEADTLARCFEILEGRAVTVRSRDPRLRGQTKGVTFVD